jgi:hypothetical protein
LARQTVVDADGRGDRVGDGCEQPPPVIAPIAPQNDKPETTAIPPTSIDPGLIANPKIIAKMSYQRTVFSSGGTGSMPNCSTPLG